MSIRTPGQPGHQSVPCFIMTTDAIGRPVNVCTADHECDNKPEAMNLTEYAVVTSALLVDLTTRVAAALDLHQSDGNPRWPECVHCYDGSPYGDREPWPCATVRLLTGDQS